VKFGANCGTSCRGAVAFLPVRATFLAFRLAGARRVLLPLDLFWPARARAFFVKISDPFHRHPRVAPVAAQTTSVEVKNNQSEECVKQGARANRKRGEGHERRGLHDARIERREYHMDWPGRRNRTRPETSFVSVMEEPSALAKAASSPGSAATTAAATTTTAAATATSAASAAAATTATTPRNLYATLGRRSVLLVEHIERRETHIGDFLFTKRHLVTQPDSRRLCHVGGRNGRC
jgi:hypothetical protein